MEQGSSSLKRKLEDIEREEIVKALKECDWVMARAAKKLGITERMIGYKIRKYGIRTKEVRWNEESQSSRSEGK
jgi:Nif-specific regulatory protein